VFAGSFIVEGAFGGHPLSEEYARSGRILRKGLESCRLEGIFTANRLAFAKSKGTFPKSSTPPSERAPDRSPMGSFDLPALRIGNRLRSHCRQAYAHRVLGLVRVCHIFCTPCPRARCRLVVAFRPPTRAAGLCVSWSPSSRDSAAVVTRQLTPALSAYRRALGRGGQMRATVAVAAEDAWSGVTVHVTRRLSCPGGVIRTRGAVPSPRPLLGATAGR
jgi:hypothetical protein